MGETSDDIEVLVDGHGVRDGKAMIATLRTAAIRVPARLTRHAGQLLLRLPPGHRPSAHQRPGAVDRPAER